MHSLKGEMPGWMLRMAIGSVAALFVIEQDGCEQSEVRGARQTEADNVNSE